MKLALPSLLVLLLATLLASLLAALLATTGCFSPSLQECAVTCSASNPCPDGNACLLDGFCHAVATDSLCSGPDTDAAPPADAQTPVDCGNGVLQSDLAEECDDGNEEGGDGCSGTCVEEAGFVCVGQPSTCRLKPSVPGDLVITELLVDPDESNDLDGEWFEVFNPTATDFDLLGMTVADEGIESFEITTSLVIASQGSFVFGKSTDTAINGGAPVGFAYGPGALLGNGGDELVLATADAITIDRVDWGLAPTGTSISLSRSRYDSVSNDDRANFCDGATAFGDGDLGTPGQENPVCP